MTRDEAKKIFSAGFEHFLTRNSLTQEAAGALFDCSKANVNKIKSGKSLPSIESLFSLVEAGMTLEEIFGEKLARKLYDSFGDPVLLPEGNEAEKRQGLLSGVQNSAMTEDEFDQKMKGSLLRLLGNLDIRK